MLKTISNLQGVSILNNEQKKMTTGGDFENDFVKCTTVRIEVTSSGNFITHDRCVSKGSGTVFYTSHKS